MIYILSGDTDANKHKELTNWVTTWDNVRGILCHDAKGSMQHMLNIETGDKYQFQVDERKRNTIKVGHFHLLKDTFKLANYILLKSFEEDDYDFLVLDELGKLELAGEGIHQAAVFILNKYESSDDKNLLLVVQTNLVKDIIAHYHITNFQLVVAETLP